MARYREHIDAELPDVERNLAACLYGVRMEKRPSVVGHPRELTHGLHNPGFVIRYHDGHEKSVRAECASKSIGRQLASFVDLYDGHRPIPALELLYDLEHRMMLHIRRHDVTSPVVSARGHSTEKREIVGLGSPAGEHQLFGPRPQERGKGVGRFDEGLFCWTPEPVNARRVAEVFVEKWQHRLERFGRERCCRVVI